MKTFDILRPMFHPLCMLLFLICGCNQNDNAPGIHTRSYETYVLIPSSPGTSIQTEYPNNTDPHEYKFYQGEARYIYVYGLTQSPYDEVFCFFNNSNSCSRDSNVDGYIGDFCMMNYDNLYFESSIFCGPIQITAPNELVDFSYTVKLGCENSSNIICGALKTFTIHVVPGTTREFKIEYHYALNYNVFDCGTTDQNKSEDNNKTMKMKIADAFDKAHTTVWWDGTIYSNLENLIDYNVDYVEQHPEWGLQKDEQLFIYAYQNRSGGEFGHDQSIGTMFSNKKLHWIDGHNHDANEPTAWENVIARTFQRRGDEATFIFTERISASVAAAGYTGDNAFREYDRVVVHELGHMRGILTGAGGDHTVGHNGGGKSVCIMFNPTDFGTDVEKRFNYIKNATFCEGHKQQLMNYIW